MSCFSQKLHLADAQDIPNSATGWKNSFFKLGSWSLFFFFFLFLPLESRVVGGVLIILHNEESKYKSKCLLLRIPLWVLHLVRTQFLGTEVGCDGGMIYIIALFNGKNGKVYSAWCYSYCWKWYVYEFICISPNFLEIVLLSLWSVHRKSAHYP